MTIGRRWSPDSHLKRVSRSSRDPSWYTCHHKSPFTNWFEFGCSRHLRRDFQDDDFVDSNRYDNSGFNPGWNKLIDQFKLGTKFVLITSLAESTAEAVLQKVYEAYTDAVMKNPFHTPEMPIRSEGFDTRITTLLG